MQQRIWALLAVMSFVVVIPSHSVGDYEPGKRAWDAESRAEVSEEREHLVAAKMTSQQLAAMQEMARKWKPENGVTAKDLSVQNPLVQLAQATEQYPAGKEFRDCDTCPIMVVVPPGTFMMGSPALEEYRHDDEGPRHQVTISSHFAVGKYEVTREQFEEFVNATGYDVANLGCRFYDANKKKWKHSLQHYWRKPGYSQSQDHPVACINWNDAQSYVGWLSMKTGQSYRLLTESEWEYAARAGTTGPFHFGSTISTDHANYHGEYTYGGGSKGIFRRKTVSVGSFPANGFGLHDVHGNVWEWVEDCWHDNYSAAPSDGSAWTSGGDCSLRVLRGGSWDVGPRGLRSAFRGWDGSEDRFNMFGFRVARTLTP